MDQIAEMLQAEIEQLWRRIYNAGAVLNALAEQLRASRDANRKLEIHVRELTEQLHLRQQELDTLQTKLSQIDKLEQELYNTQEALRSATATIEHLQTENRQFEALAAQYYREQEQVERLRAEYDALQQLYAQLTEEFKTAQEQLASVMSLEEERLQLRARIAELENEHLRAVAEREELAYLREVVERLQREIEHYVKQLADYQSLEQQLLALGEKNEQLEKQISTLQEELSVAQAEAAARAEEIAYLTERLQSAEAAIANATDPTVGEWRQYIEQEFAQRNAAYEQLRTYCQQIEAERDALKQQLHKTQQELLSLQQEYSKLQASSEEFAARYSEQFSAAHQEELQQLRRELELTEHAATQQRQQVIELSTEIERLREQIRRYEESERAVEQRIADALAPLQIKLEAADHERRHLQEQLLAQRQRMYQLEEELRGELERNILLKRRIRQLEGQPTPAHVSTILTQLQQLSEKIGSMESESIPQEYYQRMVRLLEHLTDNFRLHPHAQDDEELREAIARACWLLEESLSR